MSRRRRPREIPFSFDSFLDVVANVVGIIIRLILVVWVGARSYHTLKEKERLLPPEPPKVVKKAKPIELAPEPPMSEDPLEKEIAQLRYELAEAEAALLEELETLEWATHDPEPMFHALQATKKERATLAHRKQDLEQKLQEIRKAGQVAALSLEEIRKRSRALKEEVKALRDRSTQTQVLRYRTPVSRPVGAEEFMFECRDGRVAFIDVATLREEMKRGVRNTSKELRTRWQVQEVTAPVGAYRLRYTVERQRSPFDIGPSLGEPNPNENFQYGVSAWVVEPLWQDRGETVERALQAKSEFRQVSDRLDPQYAAVTIWVYPDSFAAFRKLRDYLYERGLVVAGRPLPFGQPISGSRDGTASRGQ